MSAATTEGPTGVSKSIAANMPTTVHITDITAADTVTALKLLKSDIADSVGKTISAEMSSEPTSFIDTTIITALITAITILYPSAPIAVAFEKLLSKVTEKILL